MVTVKVTVVLSLHSSHGRVGVRLHKVVLGHGWDHMQWGGGERGRRAVMRERTQGGASRDYHGSAKPARVAGTGFTGTGWGSNLATGEKPVPVARVAQVCTGPGRRGTTQRDCTPSC